MSDADVMRALTDIDARRAGMASVRDALARCGVPADELATLDDEAAREWLEDAQMDGYAEGCRA